MSGRGNGRRGGGILCLGGPSGQGTEGYPKTGGTMQERGHFAAREKEVATVRKWGYPVSKDERGANF